MKTEELNYSLPPELISQQPLADRASSRLLVVNRSNGKIRDRCFSNIGEYLNKGDCLVLNNTKVLPARFFARRKTGAALEGLFLETASGSVWTIMMKGTRKVSEGETFYIIENSVSKQP